MADLVRIAFLRHLRGRPTAHVRHLRRGKVVHDGTGLAFWFRPLTAVLSEVPVDDRDESPHQVAEVRNWVCRGHFGSSHRTRDTVSPLASAVYIPPMPHSSDFHATLAIIDSIQDAIVAATQRPNASELSN